MKARKLTEVCPQCGKQYRARACGPTHAIMAHERRQEVAVLNCGDGSLEPGKRVMQGRQQGRVRSE